MIRLAAGDWRATLRPEVGGALTALSWRGRDVLRPTPEGTEDPLQTACFPLVPFSNRINNGRFVFEGREVQLSPTPGFEPHALHGEGWRRPWTVEAGTDRSATLVLRHDRGDWPWRWLGRQQVELDETGMTVRLALTNVDDAPMPAGAGLHPYFVRPEHGRLAMKAEAVWRVDERLIPTDPACPGEVFDWAAGPRIADAPFVDNAYDGWNGTARIMGPEHTVRLTSDAARLHVYAPVGETFVCLEPVTHRPNAINAPDDERSGLVSLAPGESLGLTMRVTVQAAQ